MGNSTYDAIVGAVLRVVSGSHRAVHGVTRGRFGPRLPAGGQLVWVTTLGRRSGLWRATPLLAVPDSDVPGHGWVVAGSNGGRTRVPDWVRNLQAHPEGTIEVDGRTWPAQFEQVHGVERDELYARLARSWRSYRSYEVRAGRDIPVFRVRPRDPG